MKIVVRLFPWPNTSLPFSLYTKHTHTHTPRGKQIDTNTPDRASLICFTTFPHQQVSLL